MKRKMITRTIVTTTIEAVVFNPATMIGEKVGVLIAGDVADSDAKKEYELYCKAHGCIEGQVVIRGHVTDGIVVSARVLDKQTDLYGMPESDFRMYAEKLPPRTKVANGLAVIDE